MTEHDGTQTSEQAETNISAASALRTSKNTLRDSEASNLPPLESARTSARAEHPFIVIAEYCSRANDALRHPKASSVSGVDRMLAERAAVDRTPAACAACADACPHGAIVLPAADSAHTPLHAETKADTTTEHAPHNANRAHMRSLAPAIDWNACTDCGICQGVCDAFASTTRTAQDTAARILRIASHDEAAYVTCTEHIPENMQPAANTVALPCLAAGCAEFWALALTADTPIVAVCDMDRCMDCEKAGEGALERFTHAIETAQEWTGRTVGFAEEAPLARTLVEEYARNSEFDRRGMFRKFALDATEAASGTRRVKTSSVLQDFQARREKLRATARLYAPENSALADFTPEGRERRVITPRRRMLQEACTRLPSLSLRGEHA